jgi:hypothetical protein
VQKQHDQCTVQGCGRKHKARGYCQTHYMQQMRGAPITPTIASRDRNAPPICSEQDCGQPTTSKGLCATHYARLLRHGHTRPTKRTKDYKPCALNGCANHCYALGLCHRHYTRQRKLAERFGLTLQDEAQMLAAQGGVCAICGSAASRKNWRTQKEDSLHLDHDHRTGLVRGILCDNCNRAIGLLQDDPQVLTSAIVYLSRYAAEPRALLGSAISTLQAALPLAA